MTNHHRCSLGIDRESTLIEYVFDEGDAARRRTFDAHLASCPICRDEIAAMRGVRRALAEWTPPEPVRVLAEASAPGSGLATEAARAVGHRAPTADHRTGWAAVPAWARVAAAVLCVGVGSGAANVRVSYTEAGLTVRTGWLDRTEATGPAVAAPARSVEPWRGELAALADQLRREMRLTAVPPGSSLPAAGPAAATERSGDDLLRQVRALIARSEQRQQSELALRIGDVLNDVQAQRRADLARIDRTIGVVQNNTGMEVLRQREMIKSLAVRVSSERP